NRLHGGQTRVRLRRVGGRPGSPLQRDLLYALVAGTERAWQGSVRHQPRRPLFSRRRPCLDARFWNTPREMGGIMPGIAATDRWFPFARPRPRAEVRLFCFPYAGGGASIFRDWSGRLPGHVEVCPVQLPGRETRFRESAFTHVSPLVTTLAESLRPKLDRPFAFFGHSLGALVAFELSRRLLQDYELQPTHLFVS